MIKVEESTIGKILKDARENSQISIDEISNKLKVSKIDIIKFEDDVFFEDSRLYISGFIKSYAKLLQIDQELIERKIKELSIASNISNENHKLINIDEGDIYSPSNKVFYYAILIFLAVYLALFAYHKFEPKDLIDVDKIINELEEVK